MREAIEMVVKALVDDVDAVDVREVDQQGSTLIEVRVAPADMGKVIGRQGRTINALRSLARAVGLKRKHRFILEIVE
ncbi:MAG TPA: KH domain-containing protein [Pyrinomonadaceae bacterium]|nr:KH domain-containing protein [Pyrinomonadaceae bacterium]